VSARLRTASEREHALRLRNELYDEVDELVQSATDVDDPRLRCEVTARLRRAHEVEALIDAYDATHDKPLVT